MHIPEEKRFQRIFENNWIPSSTFIINEKSKLSWKQKEIEDRINQIMDNQNNKNKTNEPNKGKKISYLLHHELENELLTPNELNRKNKKHIEASNDDDVVWYLRYLIIFRFSKKSQYNIDYHSMKNIIFNILKFLYFTKVCKIENEIK